MDSFLTTLYFAYFKAKEGIQKAKKSNSQPKAAGEYDVTGLLLEIAIERGQELEALLTEYTLILKGGKK